MSYWFCLFHPVHFLERTLQALFVSTGFPPLQVIPFQMLSHACFFALQGLLYYRLALTMYTTPPTTESPVLQGFPTLGSRLLRAIIQCTLFATRGSSPLQAIPNYTLFPPLQGFLYYKVFPLQFPPQQAIPHHTLLLTAGFPLQHGLLRLRLSRTTRFRQQNYP